MRNKTNVMGAVDRKHGKARAEVIDTATRETMTKLVQKHVKYGSTVYTDSYDGLRHKYEHDVINHAVEYVR